MSHGAVLRYLGIMRKLITLLSLVLLAGCPVSTPADDAGLVDAAGSEERRDASVPDAAEHDAGDEEADAGLVDDGGTTDAAVDAGEDAGEPDPEPGCTLPPIDPPPSSDAGRSCALVDIEGAIGRFRGTWEGEVFGSFPLTGPFELPARGEMTFEIYCGDDKLLVDGALEGRAYEHPDAGPEEPGHPFSGRIYGEYDLQNGTITMIVKPATLTVGPLTGTFEVSMSGQRANDAFEGGEWCGYTTSPVGGFGGGSWRAILD